MRLSVPVPQMPPRGCPVRAGPGRLWGGWGGWGRVVGAVVNRDGAINSVAFATLKLPLVHYTHPHVLDRLPFGTTFWPLFRRVEHHGLPYTSLRD